MQIANLIQSHENLESERKYQEENVLYFKLRRQGEV